MAPVGLSLNQGSHDLLLPGRQVTIDSLIGDESSVRRYRN